VWVCVIVQFVFMLTRFTWVTIPFARSVNREVTKCSTWRARADGLA